MAFNLVFLWNIRILSLLSPLGRRSEAIKQNSFEFTEMDIKSVSFERPSLLQMKKFSIDLEEPSFDTHLRELLEANLDTHVNIVVVKTANDRTMYAAMDGKAHKIDIGPGHDPLAICYMTPAKGAGFITIGQGWTQPLFHFGEVYGMIEMDEARLVAKKLESVLPYEISDVSYGADA